MLSSATRTRWRFDNPIPAALLRKKVRVKRNTFKLYASSALLASGWADGVVLEIDPRGVISAVSSGHRGAPPDAECAAGPVLPGMPNLHSHAFQRAMAGLAERRSPHGDSFWGWRDTMYRFLAAIGPADVEAIAAQLYVEMLKAGYTAVAEFHYLHHAPGGRRYADAAELSERVIAAAGEVGIALTHLPVLYAYSDFGARPALESQRRFTHTAEDYLALVDDLHGRHADRADLRVGFALHSLRAVGPKMIAAVVDACARRQPSAPLHIHVAEQPREVEACRAWCGRRPVAWLLDEYPLDHHWCLVHATHIDRNETARLAACGAIAGLCPTTEANLGDGIFPASSYLAASGGFGIGSDSHISVSAVEELRLLEYGQRLQQRRRAVLASEAAPSVGRALYEGAQRGGVAALGRTTAGLAPGAHADLLVLDPDSPLLCERHGDALLDAWLFSGNTPAVRDVMVGGRWRIRERRHPRETDIFARFRATLKRLMETL